MVGSTDPRLDDHGRLDICLTRLTTAFTKQDLPPSHVKPLPLRLLIQATALAHSLSDSSLAMRAIANMLVLTFFFLTWPNEYCITPDGGSHPFCLANVALYAGDQPLNFTTATDAQLLAATSVKLTSATQKNAVKGGKVGHCSWL